MCQGTKSRMSCGHFHLNFHERCEAWCNEPQVQLIMHRDEQCGHCVARSEVDVSRTHHQKYFNKEKQRFMAAYHSYCVDGQQEVLVSLREEVIRANREMRALREEFPGLKHLEYQLDGIRRELADMKAMIQVQMRLVEEEGGMEELFVINERRSSLMRHRDLAVKKHGGVPQHVRESFDSQMERLLEDQIVLMKRCPQLTKLNCMERRLEHLESREKRLSSHDYLERLDSIRARQFAFEVEEKRMAKERLRPLRSIGSRMRQQAMEEKAEVKEARRAGRAVAYREPDSDLLSEQKLPFHDSLYYMLKAGGAYDELANISSSHSDDDSKRLQSRPSAASESDLTLPTSSGTDPNDPGIYRGRTQSAVCFGRSQAASREHSPAPPYSPRPPPPSYRSRQPSVEQDRYHVQSIDESLNESPNTGATTDGSQTPRVSAAPFPPQEPAAPIRPTLLSDADEVFSDDHSEVNILLNLIGYDNLSPTAVSFPWHSCHSGEHQISKLPPVSLLTSGLDSEWMMSGAIGTSDGQQGKSFHPPIYEDPLGEQEEDEPFTQSPLAATPPGSKDELPQQAVSSSSTVPPITTPPPVSSSTRRLSGSPAEAGSRRSLKATEWLYQ